MEAEIKRIAQLLFDNADTIAEWLNETQLYRMISIQFNHHKHADSQDSKNVEFAASGEGLDYEKLSGEYVEIESIKQLFKKHNITIGTEQLPKPIVTREKL